MASVLAATARRRPCVVDARLALSSFGIVTVARLAGACDVWFPKELREIVRRARTYLPDAERLVPRVFCARLRNLDVRGDVDAIARELAQWERLPQNDDLAAVPIYVLGDRADESTMPPWIDRG